MTAKRVNRIIAAQSRMEAERLWLKEHGWDLTGYIERYGTTEDPKLGDGGPAIYEADRAAFKRAEAEYLTLVRANA